MCHTACDPMKKDAKLPLLLRANSADFGGTRVDGEQYAPSQAKCSSGRDAGL